MRSAELCEFFSFDGKSNASCLILSWLNVRHSLDGDTTKNNCGFGLVSAKRASTWSEAAALLIKDLDAAAAKALVDMGHDKSTLK